MRAPRLGAAAVVLLGAITVAGGTSPAEARAGRQGDARQGGTMVAARAQPGQTQRPARLATTRGVAMHASVVTLDAPVHWAAARGAAARGAAGRGTAARGAAGRGVVARGAADGGVRGISCVPYARQVTGMEIAGNGRDWWHHAAGLYARGNQPEPGAVLAFPASGGMRLGHVAVVSRVLSAREVLVDHANWAGPGIRRGSVMRGVSVVDVSPDNDWTQVRVQVGWTSGTYGRVYPTHGFIYNRPDPAGGTMMAQGRGGARAMETASLGAQAARAGGARQSRVELAEMPAGAEARAVSPHASRHLDLSIRTLATAAGR